MVEMQKKINRTVDLWPIPANETFAILFRFGFGQGNFSSTRCIFIVTLHGL
jgi:hypothetical protein